MAQRVHLPDAMAVPHGRLAPNTLSLLRLCRSRRKGDRSHHGTGALTRRGVPQFPAWIGVPIRRKRLHEALNQVVRAAPAPQGRRRESKRAPDQPPVVGPVRETQGNGHASTRLSTPLGQTFNCEDPRERKDRLGRSNPEFRAMAIERSCTDAQTGREFRDHCWTDGQIEGLTENPARAGTPDPFHSVEKLPYPLFVDASENDGVQGGEVVVHPRLQTGRRGDVGVGQLTAPDPVQSGVGDQRSRWPAKTERLEPLRRRRFTVVRKEGVDHHRRTRVPAGEIRKLEPAIGENDRSDNPGRGTRMNGDTNPLPTSTAPEKSEQRRGGLPAQAGTVSFSEG